MAKAATGKTGAQKKKAASSATALNKKSGGSKKKASEVTALEEGKILDYITGKPLKDSAKEQVRQRIARALFHEYGISVDDMEPAGAVKVKLRPRVTQHGGATKTAVEE